MMFRLRFSSPSRLAAGAFLLAGLAVPAQAQVYRCESPNGVPVYQGTANGRNCQPIELQPLTTIPAPPLPKAGSAGAAPASDASSRAPAAQPSPGNFPKVDAAAQRARDGDRRRILEEELQKEEARLVELEAEFRNGEPDRLGNERNYQKYLDRVARLEGDIARSRGNIASIQRELAAVRQ